MDQRQFYHILKIILRLSSLAMLAQFLVHILPIRLYELIDHQSPTFILAQEFILLWAAHCLFFSVLLWQISQTPKNFFPTIKVTSLYSLALAIIVFYVSFLPLSTLNQYPSSTVWIPRYDIWLRFEAALLIFYFTFTQYGFHKRFFSHANQPNSRKSSHI